MGILVTAEDLARAYSGAACTLNGRSATVSRYVGWALVRTLDGRMVGQFSWPAVDRIMRDGASFKI